MTYKHYVYSHSDPVSGDLLYIGVGSYGRAWESRRYNRSEEHYRYLEYLISLGYTPADWVLILDKQLDKTTAHKKEYELIGKLKPRFNFEMGPRSAKKLTKDELILLQTKLNNGESRKAIARYFNIDPHTVQRILSGKSNYYNSVLNAVSL